MGLIWERKIFFMRSYVVSPNRSKDLDLEEVRIYIIGGVSQRDCIGPKSRDKLSKR